jgi:hypothetical protein
VKWKEVSPPTLNDVLSTGHVQPVAPGAWPQWARRQPEFSGAWFSYINGALATSTGARSTGTVQGYLDVERTASQATPLRSYRYLYSKVIDGRVFQAGPFKDLGYPHHCNRRPSGMLSYRSTSTG